MANIIGFDMAQQRYEQQLPPVPTARATAIAESLEQERDRIVTLRDELEDITALCSELKYLDYDIIGRIKEQYNDKISASMEMARDLHYGFG